MANQDSPALPEIGRDEYKHALYELQVQLVHLQKSLISSGNKLLVLFEGRDAAGKDGTIKRVVEHLSPRETRVVALGKPSNREQSQWYYQRYVQYLPAAEEFVLFNRSWYNRAGVEHVMGYCTKNEYRDFMGSVTYFEEMLVQSGIQLFKYYLDITKHEQRHRLNDRRGDPLKQWKLSPVDDDALKHWDAYSTARNAMLAKTHTPTAPWSVVRADIKKQARLNVIRDLLSRIDYAGKDESLLIPNPNIVFQYDESYLGNGMISR